jgi:polyhydroxybutyrate depolymerase
MKKILLFFVCFSSVVFSQTNEIRTLSINGQTRTFRVYTPAIYSSEQSVPLVLNFHGYTSSAYLQEIYTNFIEIADTANFILVHPQGLDIGGGAGWNTFSEVNLSNYDYLFVEEMLNDLKSNFNIDENRIYSTGMSNGGFMSYDLACFMSEKITAIASVTGSMISSHLNACNPERNVPILQIHGTNDATVSYTGNGGIIASVHIDSLVKFWVLKNSCLPNYQMFNLPDLNQEDNSTVIQYVYEGSTLNSKVEFFKVINGGHTWPGAEYEFPGIVTNQDFNASTEIWRFFSQHSLNSVSSASQKNIVTEDLKVYPNPSKDYFIIHFDTPQEVNLELIDLKGAVLLSEKYFEESEIKVNVLNLNDGVYFLRMNDIFHKIIVQN